MFRAEHEDWNKTEQNMKQEQIWTMKAAFLWRSCFKLMLSTGNMVLSSLTMTNISNRPPNLNMPSFKSGQFTVKGDGALILHLSITGATNSKLLVFHQIVTILLLEETHHTNADHLKILPKSRNSHICALWSAS